MGQLYYYTINRTFTLEHKDGTVTTTVDKTVILDTINRTVTLEHRRWESYIRTQ